MSQSSQDKDFHLSNTFAFIACVAFICTAIVTSCEFQNRAMVEISRINERAAEKGLEPFVPNPLNPARDYRPKVEAGNP